MNLIVKCYWISFFCWTQKIFWRMCQNSWWSLLISIERERKYSPLTVWFVIFFKIYFVFSRRQKVKPVWNNMKAS